MTVMGKSPSRKSRASFARLFLRKKHMRRSVTDRVTIWILGAATLVLSVASALIWHDVHTYDPPMAVKSAEVSVRAGVSDVEAADGLTDDGSTERARYDEARRPSESDTGEPTVDRDDHADAPQETEKTGAPTRIRIPSIGVDAAIKRVALAADGSMDVPKRPLDTAWYELGPRPGEAGSALIAGHVDWWYGARGVFADLEKVKAGDRLTVRDDRGSVATFVVRDRRLYDAEADATEVFTSSDGQAHLNLVTCAGAWDKSAKQYARRLVVFTDKVTD